MDAPTKQTHKAATATLYTVDRLSDISGFRLSTQRRYLFLCRSALSCFRRLCLAIFFRRFFFTEPIRASFLTCFAVRD